MKKTVILVALLAGCGGLKPLTGDQQLALLKTGVCLQGQMAGPALTCTKLPDATGMGLCMAAAQISANTACAAELGPLFIAQAPMPMVVAPTAAR